MIIIYNLVLYHHTFGDRKVVYICYVTSDLWVHVLRGNSNLKKKLSTQSLKKIKEFLLFDAWKVISPSLFKSILGSGRDSNIEGLEDTLWNIIFTQFIGINVKYKRHTRILKL